MRKMFQVVCLAYSLSACQDLVQFIKNEDEYKGRSVFERYSGRICKVTSDDDAKLFELNCERLGSFLDRDGPACSAENRAALAYFPDQSRPMYLCRDNTKDLRAKDTIRFIATGDVGAGEHADRGAHQSMVARAMADICSAGEGSDQNCDFVLVSGDLIYPSGVESVWDSVLLEKFERPYEPLGDLPFYMVPGNHDYEGSVTALVEYTRFSNRWAMPHPYFEIPLLPEWVHIQGVDTSALLGETQLTDQTEHQLRDIEGAFCQRNGWKLLFGHHPTLSNGSHGHTTELGPVFAGLHGSCDFDIYFSGHDHHQEHIRSELYDHIIQGAGGAKVKAVSKQDQARDSDWMQHGDYSQRFARSAHGFALTEMTAERVDIYFFDLSQFQYDAVSDTFENPPTKEAYTYHCRLDATSSGCEPIVVEPLK